METRAGLCREREQMRRTNAGRPLSRDPQASETAPLAKGAFRNASGRPKDVPARSRRSWGGLVAALVLSLPDLDRYRLLSVSRRTISSTISDGGRQLLRRLRGVGIQREL